MLTTCLLVSGHVESPYNDLPVFRPCSDVGGVIIWYRPSSSSVNYHGVAVPQQAKETSNVASSRGAGPVTLRITKTIEGAHCCTDVEMVNESKWTSTKDYPKLVDMVYAMISTIAAMSGSYRGESYKLCLYAEGIGVQTDR